MPPDPRRTPTKGGRGAIAAFVDDTLARVHDTPIDLGLLEREAAAGSLSAGAAGVAFFLHEAARLTGAAEHLALARRWCDAAAGWAAHATRGDWNDMPGGVLIGESGLGYVEALLGAREGDRARELAGVGRIARAAAGIETIRAGLRTTELLGGMAGIVSAVRDLEARLPSGPEHESARSTLEGVRKRAVAAIVARHEVSLDLAPSGLLGLAHGVAGELWALATTLGADHAVVRARLADLAALREVDEEGLVYFRPGPGELDITMFGSWCNGMAGQVVLWCEVARQTRAEEATAIAAEAAKTTSLLLTRVPGICCGLAGHSIALQSYADVSGDGRFTRRALDRLERAVAVAAPLEGVAPLGLWQGALGVALVGMTRLRGERGLPILTPLRAVARAREGPRGGARG